MAENVQPSFPGEIQQRIEVSQGSQAEGNINQNPSQGLPPPVPPVPNQPPANDHQQHAGNKNYNCLDIARFIVEILTLLVLLWYTSVTHGLWREADQANRLNVENSRLDQRAWVGVVRGIEKVIEVGSPLELRIMLRNSGKTPAKNVTPLIMFVSQLSLQKLPVPPPYKVGPYPQGKFVVQPGAEVKVVVPGITVSQGMIDELRDGVRAGYVYGKIPYDDIFNKPHCAMFCLRFNSDLTDAYFCDIYNDETDDHCAE